MVPVIHFVRIDLSAQCIAVDAQEFCAARDWFLSARSATLDEPFLKLSHGFVKQNPPLHHLAHKSLKLVLHGTLQRETRNRGLALIQFSPGQNAIRFPVHVTLRLRPLKAPGPGGVFGQRMLSK